MARTLPMGDGTGRSINEIEADRKAQEEANERARKAAEDAAESTSDGR